ncbi:hypothetical protein [Corynebacterium dentalis]|uniref:hypothetical protein n=1 Tax=Corynebacterium dentalis TaxID=2014528 RepID=UPI00289B5A47|nr:hypothetical protein [Corynebacterium dentalis]
MTTSNALNRSNASDRRTPTRGQIAAAKLMVKREQEGKSTMEISQRVREVAKKYQ